MNGENITQLAQPQTREIYAVFCGPIDPISVARIFQGITTGMNNGITNFHLLFQSTGGMVGEGVCLFNFFKALPCDLTLYNVGSVSSIATIAFLGAKKRKTSASATFMLHRTHFSPQGAKTKALKAFADSAALDDTRTEAILRSIIKLPDTLWTDLDYNDLNFSAEEAIKYGIATEIGDFAPPLGSQIYNV